MATVGAERVTVARVAAVKAEVVRAVVATEEGKTVGAVKGAVVMVGVARAAEG